ncbi:TetR family transcriptional regulator [Rathayibacter sp. AY1C4]|uniref:TetR/AcrR family transcriptional regulator n=1 Tax=Rathayibacter sp. AY1C4 TaxID=2080537 RepID=UPI000CE7DB90|nr:TetR/AcrR family transcriptional regulator [Rathayibacter sp. AY1C4]PPH21933.1 TetR family transcriptional regulator [Rathayibacter sp. AY1C4]
MEPNPPSGEGVLPSPRTSPRATRPNNRTRILDAAVRVAAREGSVRVTLEATAEEAGLTRGGMMYHFRDRADLAHALQEHVAAGWEAQLIDVAGKTADEATLTERVSAYVAVALTPSTRMQIGLLQATGSDTALRAPVAEVRRRWTPSAEETATDPITLRQFIACLAADGLWSHHSLGGDRIPDDTRAAVISEIIQLSSTG